MKRWPPVTALRKQIVETIDSRPWSGTAGATRSGRTSRPAALVSPVDTGLVTASARDLAHAQRLVMDADK
jgi:hypothetical protein